MKLSQFLPKNAIHLDVETDSQKSVFKILGELFSKNESNISDLVIDKLNERERLGSTNVGNGVAIPHTKVKGLKKTQVIFLKLKKGVDFSAPDRQKVDIVFSIIACENSESEHLLILSSIAKFVREKSNLKKLRKSKTIDEVSSVFTQT